MREAPRRGLLQGRFTKERVREHLLGREEWRPFPKAGDTEGWARVRAETRAKVVAGAEKHLGRAWEELPATLFLEFRREGNRTRYEQRHFARRRALAELALGESIEGKGRLLDDVINGVWALCEESFWGVSAHNARHSPHFKQSGLPDTSFHEVDLFAAETGALLAWVHYLLGEQLAQELPVVADRIEREVQARILMPYRTVDEWVWLGEVRRPVNNWNPWIHSNVLTCALLLEGDEDVRRQTVERVIRYLDVFLDGYHADGGCDEGPGYWGRAGASLFDCLELLHGASGGALDAYDDPLVKEIGRFIYRVHIAEAWHVNYADASAKVFPEADLVYRYGARIGDARMMAQGAYVATLQGEPWGRRSIGRELPALFNEDALRAADATPPLIRDAWLDGIQVLTAREREGTTKGLYLSAKGGHNAESHNHNDVGSFIVALDGHPVLIDVGVETYTKKTFGLQRYEIWTMQGLYHNLPAVDGVGQSPGRAFAARDVVATVDDGRAQLQLDIAGAWAPEVGIERWVRTVRLERSASSGSGEGQVVLEEEYALRERPGSLALHLMASGPVDTSEAGVLRCAAPGRPLLASYDAQVFAARVEEIVIEDARLRPVWGERVFRVALEVKEPAARGRWRVVMRAGV